VIIVAEGIIAKGERSRNAGLAAGLAAQTSVCVVWFSSTAHPTQAEQFAEKCGIASF
jgi:hypothetical protein